MAAPPSLEASERSILQFIDASPQPVVLVTGEAVQHANEAAAELLGAKTPDELVGTPIGTFAHPSFEGEPNELLTQRAKEEDATTLERVLRLDGEVRDVQLSAASIQVDGEPGFVVFLEDVTPFRSVERSLREIVALHRATLESASEGILVVDGSGDIVSYNPKFQEMWRLSEEALAAGDADQALAEAVDLVEDPEGFLAQVELLYEDLAKEHEGVIELSDGRVFEWHSRPRRVRDEIVGRVSTFRDITHLKEIEQALRATVALHETTLDATADGILVVDDQGNAVSTNERFQEMWGIPDELMERGDDEELLSYAMSQLAEPVEFFDNVQAVYDDPSRESFDVLHFLDGRVFERVSKPRELDDGRWVRVWSFRDISHLKRVERELRRNEQQFRTLYENLPVGIYRTTPDGKVLLANQRMLDMLGCENLEELQARNLEDGEFEPDYSRQEFRERLNEEGEIRGLESTWTRQDGSVLHVRESARAVRGEAGDILYYEGAVEDISDRVQAEEDLREQRDLYASLLRAQSDLKEGLIICDAETQRVVYANDAYCEITGYTFKELANQPSFLHVLVPEERDRLAQRLQQGLEGETEVPQYTARIQRKDEALAWVEGALTSVESRGYQLLIALVRDITERKVAEEALAETAERLAEAQRVAQLGSWRLDLAAEEAVWSEQMYRLFGFEPSPGTLPLEDIMDRIHPEDRARVQEAIDHSLASAEPYSLDNRILLPDGEVRWIHAQGEPEFDEDGEPVSLMGTAQDITERKAAEQEVRRLNEELEDRVEERTAQLQAANQELEAFSYSVSHDLQAPLQTIHGFTQIVLEDHEERLPDEAVTLLERVRAATQNMEDLIQALLKLSRLTRQELDTEPVNLTEVARELLEDLEDRSPEREVQWRVDPGLTAEADPRLVEAALFNLLSNAWKFTRDEAPARIHVGKTEEEGETVFFVEDNGVGFDPSMAERLFTPFQRLHSDRSFQGTGIGLATVQRIVSRHGGRVWAEGEVDGGATIYFTL